MARQKRVTKLTGLVVASTPRARVQVAAAHAVARPQLAVGVLVLASDRSNYGRIIAMHAGTATVRFVRPEDGSVAQPRLPLSWLTAVR